MGIRLGSLSSEVTRPRDRKEMDSQGMKIYPSGKRHREMEPSFGHQPEPAVQRSAL